jgi:ADP-heptose:LPS heptosyltransferase
MGAGGGEAGGAGPPAVGRDRGSHGAAPRAGLWRHDFGREPSQRTLLVLKLDHVGDFLIALPALEKLRRAFAGARITLVCGKWNEALARASGLADEVRVYGFFPESGALWNHEPVEDLARFRAVCAGGFDIALDLRVEDDTRFLLQHVDAGLRCGIGVRGRHPWLDVILPAEFEDREDRPSLLLDPDRFRSRMPVRTPFFHETDFSGRNTHLVFGPYLPLPAGSWRASFGLQVRAPLKRFCGLRLAVEVARGDGSELVAAARVRWRQLTHPASPAAVEFENPHPGATHEFRVRVRMRPLGARLKFFGVRLQDLDRPPDRRLKQGELHIGEQLSQLVQLVEDRTRGLYPQKLQLPGWREKPPELADLPPNAKRIVLAPLSNTAIRDWGLDNYRRLAQALIKALPCTILLVGAGGQREQLAALAAADPRMRNLAGDTDWQGTADIVRGADLVISNNSGIAHLAAACGTPLLALYSGSHRPEVWGPRGCRARVLTAPVACSPCGYDRLDLCPNDHLCMKLITPDAVAAEALAMLDGTAGT